FPWGVADERAPVHGEVTAPVEPRGGFSGGGRSRRPRWSGCPIGNVRGTRALLESSGPVSHVLFIEVRLVSIELLNDHSLTGVSGIELTVRGLRGVRWRKRCSGAAPLGCWWGCCVRCSSC